MAQGNRKRPPFSIVFSWTVRLVKGMGFNLIVERLLEGPEPHSWDNKQKQQPRKISEGFKWELSKVIQAETQCFWFLSKSYNNKASLWFLNPSFYWREFDLEHLGDDWANTGDIQRGGTSGGQRRKKLMSDRRGQKDRGQHNQLFWGKFKMIWA